MESPSPRAASGLRTPAAIPYQDVSYATAWRTGAAKPRLDRDIDGRFAMARKIVGAVASCIAVVLALTFIELPRASAIQDEHQRSKHRHAVSRRNRAARQRVKSQRKSPRLR